MIMVIVICTNTLIVSIIISIILITTLSFIVCSLGMTISCPSILTFIKYWCFEYLQSSILKLCIMRNIAKGQKCPPQSPSLRMAWGFRELFCNFYFRCMAQVLLLSYFTWRLSQVFCNWMIRCNKASSVSRCLSSCHEEKVDVYILFDRWRFILP